MAEGVVCGTLSCPGEIAYHAFASTFLRTKVSQVLPDPGFSLPSVSKSVLAELPGHMILPRVISYGSGQKSVPLEMEFRDGAERDQKSIDGRPRPECLREIIKAFIDASGTTTIQVPSVANGTATEMPVRLALAYMQLAIMVEDLAAIAALQAENLWDEEGGKCIPERTVLFGHIVHVQAILQKMLVRIDGLLKSDDVVALEMSGWVGRRDLEVSHARQWTAAMEVYSGKCQDRLLTMMSLLLSADADSCKSKTVRHPT